MEPGAVAAAVRCGDEVLLEVQLPATGRGSDSVAALKAATMSFMTEYLKQQHMDTDEVDLMEEVVSDGEGEGSKRAAKKGHKGKKRKPDASPKM